jgi:hypothetical protein
VDKTDVTDGQSQGGCATMLRDEYLLQPIPMLTPLVLTCYHALIHYLVIEVTRRHKCWLIKGTESPRAWRVSARLARMMVSRYLHPCTWSTTTRPSRDPHTPQMLYARVFDTSAISDA